MKKFMAYILSEKNKHSKEQEDAMRQAHPEYDDKDVQYYLNRNRKWLQNQIKKSEKWQDDMEKASIEDLQKFAADNNIRTTKRSGTLDWQQQEIDISNGINKLFQDGIFVIDDGVQKNHIYDKRNENFCLDVKGGGLHSDIRVAHGKKEFYVEGKLDLSTSEYFKYGLKIKGSQIQYDHKRYLEGADKNDADIEKINDLFENEIGIQKFLNKIVNSPEVVKSWNLFLDNVKSVKWFISQSKEFADFSAAANFTDEYPHDFAEFPKVFDAYCRHYQKLYNELVLKVFDQIILNDGRFVPADYAFDLAYGDVSHDSKADNSVIKSIDELCAQIEEDHVKLKDRQQFEKLVKQIKVIEVKFNALLKSNGISGDISKVLNFKDADKTMHFFKMFLSSAKEKKRNSKALLNTLTTIDDFGNMQICTDIPIEDDSLAKMITAFYVKKDKAPYIQIADTIYQFDKVWNPLNLPDLPIYAEAAKKFLVSMKINDALTHIGLHIRCLETDIGNKKHLSFREKDKQFYVGNQGKIEIEVR